MSANNEQVNLDIPNSSLDSNEKKFDNPLEEIEYLKSLLKKNQLEFLEFQESSRELELEYDTQIKHLEKNNDNLSIQLSKLELDNDQLKCKYNSYTNDTQLKLNEYSQQINELTALNDRLTSYIRELEQSNDDLERARRALAASLEDFEGQLNQQIERNVLLENEVSEKEELECVVQRLKEEARDLRLELVANKNSKTDSARRKQLLMDNDAHRDMSFQSISQKTLDSHIVDVVNYNNSSVSANSDHDLSNSDERSPMQANGTSSSITSASTPNSKSYVNSTTSPMTTSNQNGSLFSFSPKPPSSTSTSTDTKSQQTSSPPSPKLPSIIMSPSSRISALNIVSDLLRKVGALESKLSTAKKVTN